MAHSASVNNRLAAAEEAIADLTQRRTDDAAALAASAETIAALKGDVESLQLKLQEQRTCLHCSMSSA